MSLRRILAYIEQYFQDIVEFRSQKSKIFIKQMMGGLFHLFCELIGVFCSMWHYYFYFGYGMFFWFSFFLC